MSPIQETDVERVHSSVLRRTPSRLPAGSPIAPIVPISIVSESRLLREGLCTLLQEYIAVSQVGSYEVTARPPGTPTNPPGHLVLLDGSGKVDRVVGWTHYWNDKEPPASVVVVEVPPDAEIIVTCMEAGASGYIPMGAGVEDVAVAVQQASAGTRLLEDEIIQVAVRRLHSLQACEPNTGELDHSLSRREMEVLRCITDNKSNSEIAASLYIQLCTVKHHVHHILEKLQVQHRWDAARLAQERGWV